MPAWSSLFQLFVIVHSHANLQGVYPGCLRYLCGGQCQHKPNHSVERAMKSDQLQIELHDTRK